MTDKQRVALVTGASSGLGQVTATRLAERGFKVFGTSRQPAAGLAGVEMIELDVTSAQSVNACVGMVLTQSGRVDLLVNNAGRTHASLIEETALDEARNIFETNFWGVVRMTHAVLPTMRRQRLGLIVNVSSLAGLVGAPGMGFYCASKHALEGYTESLSVEIERFDIRVSLVEASFFRTNLHHAMSRCTAPVPDYDDVRATTAEVVSESIERGDDPLRVAEAIVAIAHSERPKLRYRVGTEAKWVPRLKVALPESWFLTALSRRFGLDRPRRDRVAA